MIKFIFLYAISRSGHTAIKNWIGLQCFMPAYSLDCSGHIFKYDQENVICINPKQYDLFERNIINFTFLKNLFDKEKKFTIIVNCENFKPTKFVDKFTLKYIEKRTQIFQIIEFRDPYNNMASLLKLRKGENLDSFMYFKNLMLEYINEIDNKTNYIENKILINYNKWIFDIEYRKSITKHLDISFTDKGFLNISSQSSFDKNCEKADEMRVLERWKYFKNDSIFRKIVDDQRLHDFSLKHFNFYLNFNNSNKKATIKRGFSKTYI